jgi:hypothetical protein
MLSRFAKLAGTMPKETLLRTSTRFFQTVAPRLTDTPPRYIFPAVAIVAGGIGYFAGRPETGDPDLKDLAPSFKTFVEDHLVKGPSTPLPYWGNRGIKESKPFDASLVKALALQAQKTLGREMVAMSSVPDLFYYPIQSNDDKPYRRRDEELRDTIDVLKHIDDKHLISAEMRMEMSKELVPTYSGIIEPLYNIEKNLHIHPETVLAGIPVIHWANVTNALLAMKKAKVDLTPKIISSLQRSPQAAESIGAGVISLIKYKKYIVPAHLKSLADTLLHALLDHTEPCNSYFLNIAHKNALVNNFFKLPETEVLSPDMANAIQIAIQSEPEYAAMVLEHILEAHEKGLLTQHVKSAIIANPCELLGHDHVHKLVEGTSAISSHVPSDEPGRSPKM